MWKRCEQTLHQKRDMNNKRMKRCSTRLIIKEMHYNHNEIPYIPTRMAFKKMTKLSGKKDTKQL